MGRVRSTLNTQARQAILDALGAEDISQAELARRMGITPQALGQMLKSGHNFTVATLENIGRALDRRFAFREE